MAVSLTYIGTVDGTVNESGVLLIKDAPIGTAAADRLVFVVARALGPSSGASAGTIGGVSATRAAFALRETGFGFNFTVEIWWAHVPSGTTADIAFEEIGEIAHVAVYTVTGADTTTPVNSSDGSSHMAGTGSIELDVLAGGALLAGAISGFEATPNFTFTWTGAAKDEGDNWFVFEGYIGTTTASRETEAELLAETISIVRSDTSLVEIGTAIAGVAIQPSEGDTGFSGIYLGDTQINAIKHGSDDIVAVYHGTTKIFEAG